jgi:D-alanyl-D-alanine-carboxypeptidase/D-alanyl-D-alanine-endopeptidase
MNSLRMAALAGSTLGWLAGTGWPALPVIPEHVKTTIRERVDYGYAPAVVVGLMNTNGPAFFSYGTTDLDGGQPVDEHTLFEIGSVTKVFTTTLLADFAQRGQLELTNEVQPYLPPGITAPTRSGRAITLTHLAAHTSGLPSMPANLVITDGNNPFSGYSEPQMYEFLDTYTLARNPGALYEYSNYGMGLLGALLARQAGSSFEDLVVQWIANDLGLADTRSHLTPDQQARLARGFSGVLPIPPFEMTALQAAGDLRSTASDLLVFLAANRGWQPTRLAPAMTEAQRSRSSTPTPGMSIALGWHLYSLNAGTAVFHDGATIGQRAFAGFLRNGQTLAVVLSNSDYDVVGLGFHLLDASVPLATVRRPATVPEPTLRHYVGRYERGSADGFAITLIRGHLTVQFSSDQGRGLTLHPSGSNRFFLTFPEASAVFTTNSSGRATSLVWTQEGTTTTYPKVPLPSRLSLARTNGTTQLTLSGDTDRDYVIQASAGLAQWSALSTNTIWDGPIVDPGSAAITQRFYRVLEP